MIYIWEQILIQKEKLIGFILKYHINPQKHIIKRLLLT